MNESYRLNSRYYRTPRPEMLPFLPKKCSRVLEIGCGQGVFAAGLVGVEEAWGIEPTEAATIAETRLHKVIRKTFEEAKLELPKKYFNLIICNDVIEHMPDHDKFFIDIKEHLAAEGVLIGSIPNVRHFTNLFDVLVGKDWAYCDVGILDRTHLRFFTARSLRRTFREHGYRIEAFEGINGGLRWKDPSILLRYKIFGLATLMVSLWYFNDIQHPQFGFRIAPIGNNLY